MATVLCLYQHKATENNSEIDKDQCWVALFPIWPDAFRLAETNLHQRHLFRDHVALKEA